MTVPLLVGSCDGHIILRTSSDVFILNMGLHLKGSFERGILWSTKSHLKGTEYFNLEHCSQLALPQMDEFTIPILKWTFFYNLNEALNIFHLRDIHTTHRTSNCNTACNCFSSGELQTCLMLEKRTIYWHRWSCRPSWSAFTEIVVNVGDFSCFFFDQWLIDLHLYLGY